MSSFMGLYAVMTRQHTKRMSISTGKGDGGYTGLYGGQRIRKDETILECLGTIDELNSFMGLARFSIKTDQARSIIEAIQDKLFLLGFSVQAGMNGDLERGIQESDLKQLELWMEELEKAVPFKGFVLPGSTEGSAVLDICRTVCRRAERRITAYAREQELPLHVSAYINRLSDLLFMLARLEEAAQGALRYRKR